MFDGVKAGNRSKVILAVSVIATVILVCLYIVASRSSFLPQKSVQSAVALTIIAVAIVEAMKRAIFYYFLNTVNKAEAKTLSELFRIIGYISILFILVSDFNANITSLLVSAGFLGIVFGLAAQSTLANFIAGLYLLATKTIEPGDHVIIHSSAFTYMPQTYPRDKFIPGFPGTIETIGVLYTTLINDDGIPIYMPNSVVSQSMIMNYHKAKDYTKRIQFDVDISIPFDKLKRIIDITMKKNRINTYNVNIEYLHTNIYVVTVYLKTYEKSTKDLRSKIFTNIVASMENLKQKGVV
ncbi:MAG: mechanosensitive ion channel [Candidatus Micrarchaeota archaeon]|nr:mechanosensitive ion channel [Candidatus Micrarchaeota archaeon]MDE1824433.1 mechanosensitive ion channel [Candidatus Micrarchaeota archaeon]MDE1850015.1 mechanosensitive ion channel [Candidatus Micrarchaeota archaeon]